MRPMSATRNYEGNEAFQKSPKDTLASRLLTAFVKNSYYESESAQFFQLKKAVSKVSDLKFIAKAAVFARMMGMRTASHVVASEFASIIREVNRDNGYGQPWAKDFFNAVVHRPDDMTEILSLFMRIHGKPIPNSLKKGFALAFGKFDEYQLGKWQQAHKLFNLKSVANLVWPTENREAVTKMRQKKRLNADTWERGLTEAMMSSSTEEKYEKRGETWAQLLESGAMPQFALLRNLRNIYRDTPDLMPKALRLLTKRSRVESSKIFPMRYYRAWEQLREIPVPGIREALDTCMTYAPVPSLPGETLVAIDVSGSMHSTTKLVYDKKNKRTKKVEMMAPWKTAAILGMMLQMGGKVDLMTFSGNSAPLQFGGDSFIQTVEIMEQFSGGSTNYPSIFRHHEFQKPYDRIVILSDGECNHGFIVAQMHLWDFMRRNRCNPRLYMFDLAGESTMQFAGEQCFLIPGYTDKVFDIMDFCEKGSGGLVDLIEQTTF